MLISICNIVQSESLYHFANDFTVSSKSKLLLFAVWCNFYMFSQLILGQIYLLLCVPELIDLIDCWLLMFNLRACIISITIYKEIVTTGLSMFLIYNIAHKNFIFCNFFSKIYHFLSLFFIKIVPFFSFFCLPATWQPAIRNLTI